MPSIRFPRFNHPVCYAFRITVPHSRHPLHRLRRCGDHSAVVVLCLLVSSVSGCVAIVAVVAAVVPSVAELEQSEG